MFILRVFTAECVLLQCEIWNKFKISVPYPKLFYEKATPDLNSNIKIKSVHSCRLVKHAKFHRTMTTLKKLFKI